MRRRPRVLVVTAIVAALLLQCAAFATAAVATERSRATELTTHPSTAGAVALPGKRLPDLAKPDRVLRLVAVNHAQSTQGAPGTDRTAPSRLTPAPPYRARSHALRIRVAPPDDPPQPTVLT